MQITEAIQLNDFPRVISIIGAGGKTSTMIALTQELSKQGKKVIATTTTHIGLEQGLSFGQLILEEDYGKAYKRILHGLQSANVMCLASKMVPGNKLKGISDAWIKELLECESMDAIIVEADGANGKSFKIPSNHDPVIPSSNHILILVIGFDALNQPITEEYIHHSERVLKILAPEAKNGEGILTEEIVLQGIFNQQGLLKESDKRDDIYVLINKVERYREQEASNLANSILKQGQRLHYTNLKVLIGQVKNSKAPILSIYKNKEEGSG